MSHKRRVPFAVSPEFQKTLKRLQGKIKAEGRVEPSLTDLTDNIVKTASFKEVEKEILKGGIKLDFNLKVRYD